MPNKVVPEPPEDEPGVGSAVGEDEAAQAQEPPQLTAKQPPSGTESGVTAAATSEAKPASAATRPSHPQDEQPQGSLVGRIGRAIWRTFFGEGIGDYIAVDISACDLSAEELEEFVMLSTFSDHELRILRARFLGLTDGKEWMPKANLARLPEIEDNPLRDRLIACFEADSDGYIDFREFVVALSNLSPSGPREKKLMLAFKIHDYDGDDKISKADLTHYLHDVTQTPRSPAKHEEMAWAEAAEAEAGVTRGSADRIDFHKAKIDAIKEAAKAANTKPDLALVGKHEARIQHLSDMALLDQVVELAFGEASSDGEYLTRDEFIRVVGHADFKGKMVIDLCARVRVQGK